MPEPVYPRLPGESTSALGTRLTAIALRNSPAAGVLLNTPANVMSIPLSPDLEDRTSMPINAVAPPPSLRDRIQDLLNTLQTKWQMTKTGLEHGGNPYWQAPDLNFYVPGHDASSLPIPLNAQQAAQIRSKVNQSYAGR